jgi:hypothetical protein
VCTPSLIKIALDPRVILRKPSTNQSSTDSFNIRGFGRAAIPQDKPIRLLCKCHQNNVILRKRNVIDGRIDGQTYGRSSLIYAQGWRELKGNNIFTSQRKWSNLFYQEGRNCVTVAFISGVGFWKNS